MTHVSVVTARSCRVLAVVDETLAFGRTCANCMFSAGILHLVLLLIFVDAAPFELPRRNRILKIGSTSS